MWGHSIGWARLPWVGVDSKTILCTLSMEDHGDGSKTTMLELWPIDRPYNSVIGNFRRLDDED